jgi:hypothetical protein
MRSDITATGEGSLSFFLPTLFTPRLRPRSWSPESMRVLDLFDLVASAMLVVPQRSCLDFLQPFLRVGESEGECRALDETSRRSV